MAKSNTGFVGLTGDWRPNDKFDSYRVQVFKDGKKIWISSKLNELLKQLNNYLKIHNLKKDSALEDPHVQTLIHRLHSDLVEQHALSEYKARERVALATKKFNYETSLDGFFQYKSDTSIPADHRARLINFWLPFFSSKQCAHPREWRQWRKQAELYLKNSKKPNGEPYAPESRVKFAASLNQYMDYLEWNEDLSPSDVFKLDASLTLEEKKQFQRNRKRNVYSISDIFEIKKSIDSVYKDNLEMKLRAYAMLFGICTGIRKGNLLGLRAKDLFPDNEVPHFQTSDNIVSGWGRGKVGQVVIPHSTKTFIGTVKLPLIQPSVEFAVEVARFLKKHIKPEDRLLNCNTHTVGRWWEQIAKECEFRAINPHAWKHSYATNGAAHLTEWYEGNPRKLQVCCMHEDFATTQKYIDVDAQDFLKSFKRR